MTPKLYGLNVLLDLCGGTEDALRRVLPWHVLRGDGLWLAPPEPMMARTERDVMQWHPRADSGLPALPIPFTEAQLAAFMLAGGGLFLFELFDEGDEPDSERVSPK